MSVPASTAPSADPSATIDPADGREVVFTLHGLGRTRVSMALLARSLERDGFRVVNWGYSSITGTVPQIARDLADEVARQGSGAPRVHFVGHSMGNIVVRYMLAHHRPPRVGRVVMLAPPNQGSRAADRFAPWLGWLLRPLPELRTAEDSTVRALADHLSVEVGVVAGTYDRKVLLEEARLAGAHHAEVPAVHSFLMNRRDVRALVTRFLRTGSFDAPGESS
jgi:triacylglycerol esterase/lipase EstA (alpha/beta hydrolase family)